MLVDPTGRPIKAPQEKRIEELEHAVTAIAERLNAQLNQVIHVGIFSEWIAKQSEDQGLNLNMKDYPEFVKQKLTELQERFQSARNGEALAAGDVRTTVDLAD